MYLFYLCADYVLFIIDSVSPVKLSCLLGSIDFLVGKKRKEAYNSRGSPAVIHLTTTD